MISIEEIIRGSVFPTIDFKFHNSGNAASYMHEFQIEVKDASVDERPSFSASMGITGESDPHRGFCEVSGDLLINITNNGWGKEASCDLSLVETRLNDLFSGNLLKTKLTLYGGESKTAFRLRGFDANQKILRSFLSKRIENEECTSFRINQPREIALSLSVPEILLSYNDENALVQDTITLNPNTNSLPGNCGGSLYLTNKLFIWHGSVVNCCIHPPSAVYYAKLNPRKGPYIKKYKISHRIGESDIERFKIMIGSEISARLKVVFKFVMEEGNIIESEVFSINIWHPRNTPIPYHYEDGADLIGTIEHHMRHRQAMRLSRKDPENRKEILFPLTLHSEET
jgi:hypothetical protein